MNKKTQQPNLEFFRKKLEKEKVLLETELKTVGHKNPSIAGGWEASPENIDTDSADDNEVADKIEGLEGNNGILEKLDKQLLEVNAALDRIEKGTYGICIVCQKPIEKERLEANPSAVTCITHLHE